MVTVPVEDQASVSKDLNTQNSGDKIVSNHASRVALSSLCHLSMGINLLLAGNNCQHHFCDFEHKLVTNSHQLIHWLKYLDRPLPL